MNDLIVTLKRDLSTKIMNEFVVSVVGATDEAFRMLQRLGDDSLRGFRGFPEGRTVMARVICRSRPDDVEIFVRMAPKNHNQKLTNVFMDFCDGEFVLVKMMD